MTLVTTQVTDHDGALEDVLDEVEKGLSRMPVDDRWRPALLTIRGGPMTITDQETADRVPRMREGGES